MNKSYNQIKAQEQRIIAYATATGRWSDNAKNRIDTQRIAQITRRALTQHGFPIFGSFDKNEPRPCIHRTEPKQESVQVTEPQPIAKAVRPTPTEQARERVAFNDWMDADETNRKQIQNMARRSFINKMYADLLGDMEICKMEGWDVMEYPRMLRDAIARIFPQPKQLTLQFS